MANRRVSIWRYTKVNGIWRYVKPTYSRNNKIKPEDGTYYVRWREGPKTHWQRCHSPQSAEQARFVKGRSLWASGPSYLARNEESGRC